MHKDSSYCRIKIAGEAGDGIITAGDIMVKAAARMGYNCSSVKTFPSNIRGGYAQSLVTIANTPIVSPVDDCTIVFSLGAQSFILDNDAVSKGVCVLVESAIMNVASVKTRLNEYVNDGVPVVAIPVVQLANETTGSGVIRSTVVIGVLCQLLSIDKRVVAAVLKEHFKGKGSEIVELNQIAFNSGHLWAQQHLVEPLQRLPEPRYKTMVDNRVILDGNQGVALGALAAGCSFYASYPITPATSVGENLARLLRKKNGFAYQAEDEIAALGSVIGASFAGAKAMTATSGPGLSLMQEFIGYASMVELPVVIVDVQRVGPSTGMPTKHSQDDLWAAVYGGHGEGPRIVVAPQNVTDCYLGTIDAFNAAERYQCPVILLSDSSLSSTREVIAKDLLEAVDIVDRVTPGNEAPVSNDGFKRFAPFNGSKIGALPKPGMPGFAYCATGIEHNEDGTPVGLSDVRVAQMTRRFKKMTSIEQTFRNSVVWDIEKSNAPYDVGVCSWGYTAAATAAAVTILRESGLSVAALYPRLLYPLCTEALQHWISLAGCLVMVEANYFGQYCSIVRSHFATQISPLTIFRGEPFLPREIANGILHLLQQGENS